MLPRNEYKKPQVKLRNECFVVVCIVPVIKDSISDCSGVPDSVAGVGAAADTSQPRDPLPLISNSPLCCPNGEVEVKLVGLASPCVIH